VHVIGFAVELAQLGLEVAQTSRMICSQRLSMALVNTARRHLVTKTKWTWRL
jgi:hypothetical protein